MGRFNSAKLVAAAAIALASLPGLGAQTSIPLRAGYTAPHRDKPSQPRQDRHARQARAAEKRSVRQRRNLRWAARGAVQLVNRS